MDLQVLTVLNIKTKSFKGEEPHTIILKYSNHTVYFCSRAIIFWKVLLHQPTECNTESENMAASIISQNIATFDESSRKCITVSKTIFA